MATLCLVRTLQTPVMVNITRDEHASNNTGDDDVFIEKKKAPVVAVSKTGSPLSRNALRAMRYVPPSALFSATVYALRAKLTAYTTL